MEETGAVISWIRNPNNPVFPVVHGTWKNSWTANPDILPYGDKYLFYYRGQGVDGKDRIGVMTVEREQFNGENFQDYNGNPIIDVGPPGSFDSKYVLDPATVEVDGKIYLYYSGISGTWQEGNNPDSIGLAVSKDGYYFNKHEDNPVLEGRSPEVVYADGIFYLLYVKSAGRGYFIDSPFEIYLAMSSDGVHFAEYQKEPVLAIGKRGEWDSRTVTTPRIFLEDGTFYMMYAGDNIHCDYSKHFGLAASMDLIHWQKYPGNPVFDRGERGSWDEGGIWFPTFINVGGTYYMWYEGYGSSNDRDKPFDTPGYSQIGMATLSGISLRELFSNTR